MRPSCRLRTWRQAQNRKSLRKGGLFSYMDGDHPRQSICGEPYHLGAKGMMYFRNITSTEESCGMYCKLRWC